MATLTSRQYGRRGTNNNNTVTTHFSNSGSGISRSSTGFTTVPQRRYVLDVPKGRTTRSNHTRRVNYRADDEYDDQYARSRSVDAPTRYSTIATTSNIYDENGAKLSRSHSREYYLRDNELIESGVRYSNTAAEDQEIQAITARATPDVKYYPINVDNNPELIVRPNTERITYPQDVAIRYLKPHTPPPPGPIIIREVRAPAPPPAPPMILRQRPPPPRTPSPIIIREKPPPRPKSVPTTVIKKIIPPPPPPPRKLIIERLPMLPPKPRPIIIERWLPYNKQRRQVIHEKVRPLEPSPRIKNTIIEWRSPQVDVVQHVKKLGVTETDPQRYYTQYGDKLYTSEFVHRKLNELGLQEELALIREQESSSEKTEIDMEKTNEYHVRQILDGYIPSTSAKHLYSVHSNGTGTRLANSSSHPGIFDEYGERRTVYESSLDDSATTDYRVNGYNFDRNHEIQSALTEEMLLRSYADNHGKFPTHLLTKLGSNVYDMPSDHVDLLNNGERITTRSYSVEQNEPVYRAASLPTVSYDDDRYHPIRASDSHGILANYDIYTSTGQKLEGEQINF